jgi:hypothetical protein
VFSGWAARPAQVEVDAGPDAPDLDGVVDLGRKPVQIADGAAVVLDRLQRFDRTQQVPHGGFGVGKLPEDARILRVDREGLVQLRERLAIFVLGGRGGRDEPAPLTDLGSVEFEGLRQRQPQCDIVGGLGQQSLQFLH